MSDFFESEIIIAKKSNASDTPDNRYPIGHGVRLVPVALVDVERLL